MSKHNWRTRAAAFITGRSINSARPLSFWDINRFILSATASVLGLYFLAMSGLGIWSWYEQNREARYEYHQRATQDQRKSTQQIASSCAVPGAPADFVSMCLAHEIDEHRARFAANEDLQAQQEMAWWTAITGTVSVVGVPLSVAGLFALWLSLRQTRQAISIDREVGHAQVRAYLSVAPVKYGPEGKPSEIRLINSGQSPARKVRHIAATSKLIWPIAREPGLLVPQDGQVIPSLMLGPGAETTIGADWLVRDDELAGEHLCSYGIVYYEDVFGKAYALRFLAKWSATRIIAGPDMGVQFHWEPAPFHNEELEASQ